MFECILKPFKIRFGKDKIYYKAIDRIFGFCPNNIELYKLALIHKSASVILDDGTQINNERLEFLGDSVIQTIVSDYLFIEFPHKDEGFLTQLRSKIVSRSTLNKLAHDIGLDEYVQAHNSTIHIHKHLFGDALEAMVGAIYLDMGYNYTNRLLINKIMSGNINLRRITQLETDFKSRLIELCQKNHYKIAFNTKPSTEHSDKFPRFVSVITINGYEYGEGEGNSKKEAEQYAARFATKLLKSKFSPIHNIQKTEPDSDFIEPTTEHPSSIE